VSGAGSAGGVLLGAAVGVALVGGPLDATGGVTGDALQPATGPAGSSAAVTSAAARSVWRGAARRTRTSDRSGSAAAPTPMLNSKLAAGDPVPLSTRPDGVLDQSIERNARPGCALWENFLAPWGTFGVSVSSL
jgi:hypothetical protein